MSPPTTVGDVADMQLCVIKQGSPPVLGNVAFFVTDLLTVARCAESILNISVGLLIVIGSYLPPEFPFFHGWGLTQVLTAHDNCPQVPGCNGNMS